MCDVVYEKMSMKTDERKIYKQAPLKAPYKQGPLTGVKALEMLDALTLITPLTGVRGPSNAVTALDALTALERLTALDGPMWGCSRYASYSLENFTETELGYSKSLF